MRERDRQIERETESHRERERERESKRPKVIWIGLLIIISYGDAERLISTA